MFPAQFTLVASTNPCPCGYYGDTIQQCTCSPRQREQYWAKLSGALMDRIDLQVAVNRLKPEEITQQPTGETSTSVLQRVQQASDRAITRFQEEANLRCNAQMQSRHLQKWCKLDDASRNLLEIAIRKLGLSARASDRILKVARTIADLAGDDELKLIMWRKQFNIAQSTECNKTIKFLLKNALQTPLGGCRHPENKYQIYQEVSDILLEGD